MRLRCSEGYYRPNSSRPSATRRLRTLLQQDLSCQARPQWLLRHLAMGGFMCSLVEQGQQMGRPRADVGRRHKVRLGTGLPDRLGSAQERGRVQPSGSSSRSSPPHRCFPPLAAVSAKTRTDCISQQSAPRSISRRRRRDCAGGRPLVRHIRHLSHGRDTISAERVGKATVIEQSHILIVPAHFAAVVPRGRIPIWLRPRAAVWGEKPQRHPQAVQ